MQGIFISHPDGRLVVCFGRLCMVLGRGCGEKNKKLGRKKERCEYGWKQGGDVRLNCCCRLKYLHGNFSGLKGLA